MKKFLLTVLALVCVSIGAWAGPAEGYELKKDAIGKWSVSGSSIPEEKVIYLKITKASAERHVPGGGTETVHALQAALGELTTILSGSATGAQAEYYSALGADNVTNNRLILKVVYEPANGEPATLTLSAEDLQALANINVATIDLQDSKIANDGLSVNNSHVRNLILPDGYTKSQVNTAVIGCNSLDAAFSVNPNANIPYNYNGPKNDGISLTAYVASGKGGTLWNAIRRSGYQDHNNTKVGTGVDPWNYSLTKVKEVAISGYPSARDYCSGTKNFDANGHFRFDVTAVEQMDDQARTLVGTPAQGALDQAELIHLDLSDAVIYPSAEEDLILSKTGVITSATTRVDIPTSIYVTTLPADFLNMDHGICQLLIPNNIQYIRTRAFKGHTIDHIWTNDADPTVKDDNGIILNDGTTAYGYQESVMNHSNYKWATYTFSSNLKVIETAAFGVQGQRDPRVKDLYVLAQSAPECHVDAFPPIMYMGNNRFDSDQVDADGIVTRDAYLNSNDNNTWITVLHYPRECGTPDVQRYTDPTREYSIATGDVDGNGSPIYYPNQCEFDRAYQQGTTGYLWNAWDDTRTTDGSGAFKNTSIDRHTTFTGWSVENQGAANSVYADNSTTPAETLRFTSFYDVTANGTYAQPDSPTPLVLYSNVYRGGGTLHDGNATGTYTQLYPSMTTTAGYYKYVVSEGNTGTLYVKNGDNYELFTGTPETGVTYYNRVQTQARDEDGSLMYETCNNNPQYVEDYVYEKRSNGQWVRDLQVTENTNGNWVKEYSWVESTTGELYYHPFVKATSSDVANFSKYYYYNSSEDAYVEDANGLYIKKSDVNQGAGYELASNASSWWGGQYNISELTHYSLKHVWHKCTKEDDYYSHANHPGVWEVSANYVLWSSGAIDYESSVAEARALYNKVYADPVEYRRYVPATDANETRYDVQDNGYVEYTDAFAGQQRYDKVPFYRLAEAGETPTHCPVMEDAFFHDIIASHDYRGWHQFVLTAYSHNSELVFEPLKSYITDNDWWTICAPYDLRRSDMILLFGDKEKNQIPYLSKLVYVVRDVENEKITLMFSKNLMQYKEYEMVGGVKKSINEGSHVHGIVDDTEWTDDEIAADPIILHRGVPYLIKPYMSKDNSGKFNRQFDIYSENQPADLTLPEGAIMNEGLYQEFRRSRSLTGDQQKDLIYKGEYRVPAFVINNDGVEATENGDLTIKMNDNSTFTYGANSAFSFKNSTYDMKVSSDFTYTFVGTFYKSLMPQYSYFLGWDSKKGKAAFWYNRVNNTQDYTWNNETGIICANWSLNHKITAARGSDLTPARWESDGSGMGSDDFASATGAKGYMDMEFGNAMDLIYLESGVATGVKDVSDNRVADDVVYDIHGVRMGTSVNGLAKGVYIKNGKKIIVR